jgi:hypothetical protein
MHYCDACSDCECTCVAYCEECGCHDISKPPASVAYTPQPTRGDEQKDSTFTEWQPLSHFNSTRTHRLPLSNAFARGYPSVYVHTFTVGPGVSYRLASDDALGAVLRSPCSAMFHVIRRWRVAPDATARPERSQAL